MRLSPTESGFVEGELNTTAAGQNAASSGRNSAQGFVEGGSAAGDGGPKRAASGSIYSIMPRSASLLCEFFLSWGIKVKTFNFSNHSIRRDIYYGISH